MRSSCPLYKRRSAYFEQRDREREHHDLGLEVFELFQSPGFDSVRGITDNTDVRRWRVVLDTNVVVAALRSRRGASFQLLSLLATDGYEVAISVPLLFEYEFLATLKESS